MRGNVGGPALLDYERKLWSSGLQRVAGVDEAGRGPLAGPVVAAAVVIRPDYAEKEALGLLEGLTDSKKLTEARRDHFFDILSGSSCIMLCVGLSEPDEIDSINILNATHTAMTRAVSGLEILPEHVIVDGLPVKGLPCDSTAIVKGDALSLSIAAASVIAKVTRDRIMRKLDKLYPEYGFCTHKGYGSKRHIQALFEYGPSPIHRRSFRPVREAQEIRDRRARNTLPHSGAQLEWELAK